MPTKCGTHFVGRRAAENALQAVRYAGQIGRPINAHITISFDALGIHGEQADAAFRYLQMSIGRWWQYQREGKGRDIGPPVAIYAHANPAGSRHVHMLLHLPESLSVEFVSALAKRLRKLGGQNDLGEALHSQTVGGPGGLAKYVLRGIDPAFAQYFHIRPSQEGWISCRRTGTSRHIGRAARVAAGWSRKARNWGSSIATPSLIRPADGSTSEI